jgi:peptidoglycan hydrolase-like protein with peptidoglycan-binding domain
VTDIYGPFPVLRNPTWNSDQVRRIQRILKDWVQPDLAVDGDFGDRTETAVRSFQDYAGIAVTGVVDDPTWWALLDMDGQPGSTADAGGGRADTSNGSSGEVDGQAAGWRPPAPGPVALVAGDGSVLGYGVAHHIDRQGEVISASEALETLIEWALPFVPGDLGTGLELLKTQTAAARSIATETGWTVAFGVGFDIGLLIGLTGGGGIYVAPDGDWGFYTSIGADIGLLVGGGVTACFTAVRGGPQALQGGCFAFELQGGEGLLVGASFLFGENGDSIGFAIEIGYGFGIPINYYAKFTETHLYSWSD